MKGEQTKECPVCGRAVVGRIDKVYCSDDCRIYAGNYRNRERRNCLKQDKTVEAIGKDLALFSEAGAKPYIKIIAAVTQFCKIMYKFGHQNK